MQPVRSFLIPVLLIQFLLIDQLFAASKSNSSIAEIPGRAGDVVPNVIVIKFSEDYQIIEKSINTQNVTLNSRLKESNISSLEKIFKSNPGGFKKPVSSELSNIYLAYFEGEKTPREIAKLVSSWPGIEFSEPKFIHFLTETPNDSLYANQSAYYDKIQAPQAWDRIWGEEGDVVIAIVDGGTDINHPDLIENIWQNQVEVDGSPGVDDDGNGFVDDYYGWNFANQSGDPTGLPGTPSNADHGTHTAGISSAESNNVTGVAGTSWNATVMAINASDEETDQVIKYGYEGIIYSAENGADIISCSWGREGEFSYFGQEVVNYATSLGALVVAAAGNNNSDIPFYPASYANALSIAGTTVDDERSWDSNYGPNIDLAAPSVNIYSTLNNNRYGYLSGTSMSTPMVAGTAGLVKTLHPAWSGVQIGEQVRVTSDSLPEEQGQLGRGRLNVYRALTEASPSIRLTANYSCWT